MQKDANLAELEKCCRTHIFLQNFVFDTAENEPAKNLQNFIKFVNFPNFADPNPTGDPALAEPADLRHPRPARRGHDRRREGPGGEGRRGALPAGGARLRVLRPRGGAPRGD